MSKDKRTGLPLDKDGNVLHRIAPVKVWSKTGGATSTTLQGSSKPLADAFKPQSPPVGDELDRILATIGVEGIEDKHVVGRTGAKASLRAYILAEVLKARIDERKWLVANLTRTDRNQEELLILAESRLKNATARFGGES